MAEPIDIAYVEIRPDVRGFGAEAKRGITRELRGADTSVRTRATSSSAGGVKGTAAQTSALAALAGSAGTARIASLGAASAIGAIGAAAVIAGIASAKAAISFEDSFAGVRKTVNATQPELDALGKAFLDLSTKIPVSANELNSIGAAAGALGIQKGAILGFTDVVAKLAVTTDLTSATAADSLARLANITQLPQTQFENLGSTLVSLGNKTAATESEIVAFGLRIAGAGKQIGLSQGEILGFGAALASVGIEAEAGGTAISTTFIRIAQAVEKGGTKLQDFAAVSGESSSQFAKQFKDAPAKAILAFIQGLGRVKTEGGSVFSTLDKLGLGGIRTRDALLRASGAGTLFADSLRQGNSAFAANNALNKEASIRFGTTASQIQLMKNNITALEIEVGGALLPAVNEGAKGIGTLVKELRNSEDAGKLARGALDAIKAVVGPTVLVFKKLGPSIKGAIGDIARVFSTIAVAGRPLLVLFGVQIAASFGIAIKVITTLADIADKLAAVFRDTVDIIIIATDKFLGSLSTLAGAASHIPLVGDKFKKAQVGIDEARSHLRDFSDDLDAIDGKEATYYVVGAGEPEKKIKTIQDAISGIDGTTATVHLNLDSQSFIDGLVAAQKAADAVGQGKKPEEGAASRSIRDATRPPAFGEPGFKTVAPQAVPGGTSSTGGLTGDVPKAVQIRNQRLQDQVTLAKLNDKTTEDDKKALRALIAFSAAQAANIKLARDVRRQFHIQEEQARADIRQIDKDAADAASQAATDATAAATQKAADAVTEREGVLQANLSLAQTTKNRIDDDKKALAALISFYAARVKILGATTAAGKQALVNERQAQSDLRDLRTQAASETADLRLARLEDNVTIAKLTRGSTKDDIVALTKERDELRKRWRASKANSAERRKWLIRLKETENELADVRNAQTKVNDAQKSQFAAETFGFLQRQQGFVSNLLSNLIPGGAASGLVTAGEASPSGATSTAVRPSGADSPAGVAVSPRNRLSEAQAQGDQRQGLTAGQANQLIALNRQMLNALLGLKDGSAFPEAGGNAIRNRAAMEMF